MGNKDACKILAKQLVQLRNQKTRTYAAGAKMSSIQSQAKEWIYIFEYINIYGKW